MANTVTVLGSLNVDTTSKIEKFHYLVRLFLV